MILVTLPIRTMSEANVHAHWRGRHARAKSQRGITRMAVASRVTIMRYALATPRELACPDAVPYLVTLTRIAPRELDSDNLAGSQKHVRDGVADALGIDDRDPRVLWRYAQRRGKPKEYAVEIRIEAGGTK